MLFVIVESIEQFPLQNVVNINVVTYCVPLSNDKSLLTYSTLLTFFRLIHTDIINGMLKSNKL